jgi:hypothetical protein
VVSAKLALTPFSLLYVRFVCLQMWVWLVVVSSIVVGVVVPLALLQRFPQAECWFSSSGCVWAAESEVQEVTQSADQVLICCYVDRMRAVNCVEPFEDDRQ